MKMLDNVFSKDDLLAILCIITIGITIIICGKAIHTTFFEELFNAIKFISNLGAAILMLVFWKTAFKIKNQTNLRKWLNIFSKVSIFIFFITIPIGAAIHAYHVLILHHQFDYLTNLLFHLAATLIGLGYSTRLLLGKDEN